MESFSVLKCVDSRLEGTITNDLLHDLKQHTKPKHRIPVISIPDHAVRRDERCTFIIQADGSIRVRPGSRGRHRVESKQKAGHAHYKGKETFNQAYSGHHLHLEASSWDDAAESEASHELLRRYWSSLRTEKGW